MCQFTSMFYWQLLCMQFFWHLTYFSPTFIHNLAPNSSVGDHSFKLTFDFPNIMLSKYKYCLFGVVGAQISKWFLRTKFELTKFENNVELCHRMEQNVKKLKYFPKLSNLLRL